MSVCLLSKLENGRDYVDLYIFTFISTVIPPPTLKTKRQYGKFDDTMYGLVIVLVFEYPRSLVRRDRRKNIVESGNPIVLVISSIHEAYLFVLSRGTSIKNIY